MPTIRNSPQTSLDSGSSSKTSSPQTDISSGSSSTKRPSKAILGSGSSSTKRPLKAGLDSGLKSTKMPPKSALGIGSSSTKRSPKAALGSGSSSICTHRHNFDVQGGYPSSKLTRGEVEVLFPDKKGVMRKQKHGNRSQYGDTAMPRIHPGTSMELMRTSIPFCFYKSFDLHL